MKKRVFAAVVAAAMVVTAFTGCGSTGSSAGSDSKSEAKAEVPTEPFGDMTPVWSSMTEKTSP